MEAAVGAPTTVKKFKSDSATLFGLSAPAVTIVKTTTLLIGSCCHIHSGKSVCADPMTRITLVAFTRKQAAGLILSKNFPTVALQEAAASCAVVMNLVPVTVMLLPT
jgi:hypothetical protein